MDKIILKPRREESLLRYHPWVFSGAIAQMVGHPAEGDLVGVYSSDGQFLRRAVPRLGALPDWLHCRAGAKL